MSKLTAAKRSKIPTGEFAGPDRSYPIENESHARNALARVSQHGGSELKARVRAKVRKKFPGIEQAEPKARGGQAVHGHRGRHRLDRKAR